MVSKRSHLMYHFSVTIIHLHLASFYAQNHLKKITYGKMLIEQKIESELKGPRPPGRTCTPITG